MPSARRFQKSSAGIWLPSRRAAQRATASLVQVFAQHDVVFPSLPHDFEEFKRLVRSLSRTDTLLWCARLNLHFGHAIIDEPKDVQKRLVSTFFNNEEVGHLNRLVAEYGEGTAVFFRGQLLELMRWVALLSTDQPGDGTTFRDPAVRHAFARAALLASDVWARRVYPDELKIESGLDATRRRILAMLRQANVETSGGPHPLLALARGVSVADHLRRRMPNADDEFRRKTKLTFEEYFSILTYLAAMTLRHSVADFTVPEASGLLQTTNLAQNDTPLGRKLRAYFSLESQSPDELRDSLWGNRTDSTEHAARPFLFRPLRAKPLLRADANRAIILDAALFAERPTAGPLFHLVAGQKGGAANQTFGVFGEAFEDYVRDVMGRIFPEAAGTPLVRRYIPSPRAIDQDGNELEIADGLLIVHDTAVLFEAKAVWIREDLSSPDTEPGKYIEHLRGHYGVSSSPKAGNRRVKGVGQLARAIGCIGDGSLRTVGFNLDGVLRILPVLLVHDVHLNAPAHPHFLAGEFVAALGKEDDVVPQWREMSVGAIRVAHLLVLTVDDIELLETSSERFSVLTCLQDYVTASPDRMMSFYNFLVTSRYRERLRYSKWLGDKCDELLARVSEHLSAE